MVEDLHGSLSSWNHQHVPVTTSDDSLIQLTNVLEVTGSLLSEHAVIEGKESLNGTLVSFVLDIKINPTVSKIITTVDASVRVDGSH